MPDALGLADWMADILDTPVREMMQKIRRDTVPHKEMIWEGGERDTLQRHLGIGID